MKDLELFETRQTWTFNFAVAVYALAIGGLGPAVGAAFVPAVKAAPSAEADVTVASLAAIFSIILPMVMLPLCYLFVDVSVYCAALNGGYLKFNRKFEEFGLADSDPALRAFKWLKANKLDIHKTANRRTYLFLLAPIWGCFVALLGLFYSYHFRRGWPYSVAGPGLAISALALFSSGVAYQRNAKARSDLSKTRSPGADDAPSAKA